MTKKKEIKDYGIKLRLTERQFKILEQEAKKNKCYMSKIANKLFDAGCVEYGIIWPDGKINENIQINEKN